MLQIESGVAQLRDCVVAFVDPGSTDVDQVDLPLLMADNTIHNGAIGHLVCQKLLEVFSKAVERYLLGPASIEGLGLDGSI